MAVNEKKEIVISGTLDFWNDLMRVLEKEKQALQNIIKDYDGVLVVHSNPQKHILLYEVDEEYFTDNRKKKYIELIMNDSRGFNLNLIKESVSFLSIFKKIEHKFLDYFITSALEAVRYLKERFEKRIIEPGKLFYCLHYGFIIGRSIEEFIKDRNQKSELINFYKMNFKTYLNLKPNIYRYIMLYSLNVSSKNLFGDIKFSTNIEDLHEIINTLKLLINDFLNMLYYYDEHVDLLIEIYKIALALTLI